MALIDCLGRPDHHFAEGAEDKRSWVKWLVVAIVTVPILVGYLLLVGTTTSSCGGTPRSTAADRADWPAHG